MEIRVATLRKILTVTGLMFYGGIIGFVSRVVTGGAADAGSDKLAADLEGNVVNQVLGLAILLICLFLGFRRKVLVRPSFWLANWSLMLLVGFAFLSVVWSVEPGITLKRSIAMLGVVAFAAYLAQIYSIEQLFRMVGLLFGAAAAIGLLWAVVAPGKAFLAGGLREGAFVGIYVDKNGGARAYVLAILMLLPFVLKRDRAAMLAAGCCMLALALSQSASGLMLLLIGVGSALYLRRLSGRTNLLLNTSTVILGLCLYAVLATVVTLAYQVVLELVGRDPTLTNRTLIWELIIPLMMDKFTLGYGFGAFWAGWGAEEFIERWGYIGNAHNGYLEIMLHGGIAFMICFVVLQAHLLLRWVGRLIRAKEPIYAAVAIALMFQMLVANYIAYALPNYRSYDFFIFAVVALAIAQRPRVTAGGSDS